MSSFKILLFQKFFIKENLLLEKSWHIKRRSFFEKETVICKVFFWKAVFFERNITIQIIFSKNAFSYAKVELTYKKFLFEKEVVIWKELGFWMDVFFERSITVQKKKVSLSKVDIKGRSILKGCFLWKRTRFYQRMPSPTQELKYKRKVLFERKFFFERSVTIQKESSSITECLLYKSGFLQRCLLKKMKEISFKRLSSLEKCKKLRKKSKCFYSKKWTFTSLPSHIEI